MPPQSKSKHMLKKLDTYRFIDTHNIFFSVAQKNNQLRFAAHNSPGRAEIIALKRSVTTYQVSPVC